MAGHNTRDHALDIGLDGLIDDACDLGRDWVVEEHCIIDRNMPSRWRCEIHYSPKEGGPPDYLCAALGRSRGEATRRARMILKALRGMSETLSTEESR